MSRSMIHLPARVGTTMILLFLLVWLLAGCNNQQALPQQQPVALHKDDVCAVCGMYMGDSPGPRAEAYVNGYKQPLKFDSTRDFFAYVLQPENASRLQHLFVQDSARIDWEHPSDSAASFVDARAAFYVAWQPLPGSMGPTLASYAKRVDAEAFAKAHGGEVLGFDEVTPELTSLLGDACPAQGSAGFRLVRRCLKKVEVGDPPH